LYLQIVLLFLALIILPAFLFYRLLQPREKSLLMWLLRVSFTGAFIGYLFFAGPWSWITYYLRYLLLGLFVFFAILSFTRVEDLPLTRFDERQNWWPLANYGFSLLAALVLLGLSIRGQFYRGDSVELALPFDEGNFYVAQGGNSIILNYARYSQSQQFAVDILELNRFGRRASGIYPSDLKQYKIFGQSVHSPCSGRVAEAVDGYPDLIPPERDQDHPAGNHVVLTCENVRILLAHLQQGSIAVEGGERVETGQKLGLVGNSGNTTEPHLHIHAVDGEDTDIFSDDAVPILFSGRLPTRNTVFSIPEE